ncbi:MAG: polysaccharide biosynthesis/export family protein [Planctomycetaceae bacterium]|jgi:polysaccharide export outer membrane protein|nr:polysaccharide biosynthesis/export family protein [Planctomycetaceae bacterium]
MRTPTSASIRSASLQGGRKKPIIWSFCVIFLTVAIHSGCVSRTAFFDPKPAGTPIFRDVPSEAAKSSLPYYFLEPPDIINVEAIHLAPKSPYALRVFDVIAIDVIGTPPDDPISGPFSVEPGGDVKLGSVYGSVKVEGLSLEDAEQAITRHLTVSDDNTAGSLANPVVSVKLMRMTDMQQIAGNHMIGPDGYITLGSYGRVFVNGLTVDECREAIEFQLSKQLDHPQVAVDIFSYNSKAYYVIFQSSALGEQLLKFPYTGNENVIDAIANTNGLAPNSSKRMWIARPVGNSNKPVILPVDWVDITAYGKPDTNYQLLPGDRVFVVEDRFTSLDGTLARVLAPFERILGFSTLAASTATRFYGKVMTGGGERGMYGY